MEKQMEQANGLLRKKDDDKGLRFNAGKLRYDLINPKALEGLVKVLTNGAIKYADRNWENGMKWSKVIESLERHLAAINRGEDYDPETGNLHIDHLQCNAHFLSAYYQIYPQGDNRPHKYLQLPKIGLDVDEVLADWIGGYKEFYGHEKDKKFNSWYLHFKILDQCKNDLNDNFYARLKPKIKPEDIPFEPHCYVTNRNVKQETTEQWLYEHGFPCVPVYTVPMGESKVDVMKTVGVEWFVDDVYKNFVELNKAGICCFLLDAPHNKRFEVGHKRIYHLKDLLNR